MKCDNCKDFYNCTVKATFVISDNKYNIKKEDDSFLMEKSVELEESTNLNNNDEIEYCLLCRNWEL